MKKESLSIERTFDASIDKVWKAISDPQEMKSWYFKLEDFKPEVGFRFDFMGGEEGGKQYLHLCEITTATAGKELAYTWRYDNYPGNSLVTWQLIPVGEQTLLRLKHEGIETLAQGGPEFSKASFAEGWAHIIHVSLKKHLTDGH